MNIINKPPYVAITGVGKAHGEIEVNNEQMALIVRNAVYQKFERSKIDLESEWAKGKLPSLLTDADWILSRTGISRRYFTDRAPSDLAVEAVKQALAMSGLKAEAIDFIIFTTVNPDYPFSPPTASVLHGKLGLSIIEKVKEQLLIKNCITFDLSDACTSFGSGLAVGWSLIASGLAKRGIVIGADRMSTTVDKADRNFSILLGDAAGVFVLESVKHEARNSFPFGHQGFTIGTDPSGAMNIIAKAGGAHTPITLEILDEVEATPDKFRPDMLWQDGKKVFKEIINLMIGVTTPFEQTIVGRLLANTGLELSEIDIAFFHQANLRINNDIETRMIAKGLRPGVVYNTISEVGNTTSAALPYGVTHAYEAGRLLPGMLALLAAFGGGYTWALVPIRWTLTEPC